MKGFWKWFDSIFGMMLFLAFVVLTAPAAFAGNCQPQQIVLQQVQAHPVRQQIVQPVVVRQQVIRQQVAPAAPRVEVIRRGIFGIPRTAVRVN
jgi:hypothetical protein